MGSGGGYAQSGEVVTMSMSLSDQLQVSSSSHAAQSCCRPAADAVCALQLLPPGQTKAVGVGRLLKQLGVKPEQMLAIGDSESDVSTLQLAGKPPDRLCRCVLVVSVDTDTALLAAGLAVAMGNASQEVKDVAHEHTGTQDEDGVAAAIKKFVLQPRGL